MQFNVYVVTSPFDSKTVQQLQLAAGEYLVQMQNGGANIGDFTVNTNGTIDYATSLDTEFSGRGSGTLAVLGHAITINATPLVPDQSLMVYAITIAFDSATVQRLQLAAGDYLIQDLSTGSNLGVFTVTPGGTLEYDPSLDNSLRGRNTSTLWAMAVPGAVPPPQFTLAYHGGDLMGMPAPVNIYILLYGNWTSTQAHYFINLAQHLGDSSWYNILTQYKDHSGTYIHAGAHFAAVYRDNYSHGTHIDDGWATRDVESILGDALNSGDHNFVRDSNGVYMVLLSPDVSFTSSAGADGTYCAYHRPSLIGAQKYAPLPAQYAVKYPNGCNWAGSTNSFLDGLATSFVHELVTVAASTHAPAFFKAPFETTPADKKRMSIFPPWRSIASTVTLGPTL
jgi:hypothetical protein